MSVFSTPTALILGAGASQPYGFSLGVDLKQALVERLSGDEGFKETLLACGHGHAELHRFAERLGLSAQQSIDAFLERAPEFSELGKRCIVLQIASEEKRAKANRLRPVRRDQSCWYSELYRSYGAKLDDYKSDKLIVVTFNYDRSLEEFFTSRLCADYGVNESAGRSIVNGLGILHFHGHLGDLPFGAAPTPQQVVQAAKWIHIISDAEVEASPVVRNTRDWLLMRAETIAFLGFGYHQQNVERLQISDDYRPGTFGDLFNHKEISPIQPKSVLGTTVRMSKQQIKVATSRFSVHTQLGDPDIGIAEYLRDHVWSE
jgi:hypothetical protein